MEHRNVLEQELGALGKEFRVPRRVDSYRSLTSFVYSNGHLERF